MYKVKMKRLEDKCFLSPKILEEKWFLDKSTEPRGTWVVEPARMWESPFSKVRNRKGAESGLVLESNSVLHKSFSLRIVSIPVSMQWNTIQHWIYCTFGLKDSTALSPNDLRYLQMELLTGTKTCWSKQAQGMYRKQNIAKAQRTRGLSSVVTKLTSF